MADNIANADIKETKLLQWKCKLWLRYTGSLLLPVQ